MFPILKVLISRPNVRLGNTLMLTPLIRELQQRLPDARVDILTACQDSDRIFCGFDNVDSIIQLPRHGARHPLRFLKKLKEIAKGYDLALAPCPAHVHQDCILNFLGHQYVPDSSAIANLETHLWLVCRLRKHHVTWRNILFICFDKRCS